MTTQNRTSAGGKSLSLIVPCYSIERHEDLLRLVACIESQSEPIDEVIFVVQQSERLHDLLTAGLNKSSIRDRAIVDFLKVRPGVARARNRGVDLAQGDIIAFSDDDAILAPDWAEQTRRAYTEFPEMIGLAGAVLPMWDSPAMRWFPRELYWMLSCTYWEGAAVCRVRNGYGVNMSFWREAFDCGRRFDPSLGIGAWGTGGWRGIGGEEPELCLRICSDTGRDILYVPDVQVWHRVRPYRLGAAAVVRRAYWEGRFKALLAIPHGSDRAVLETEHELLRTIADNSVARLRMLWAYPRTAVRQQAVVTVAVTSVLCGYLEGCVRRIWRGRSLESSQTLQKQKSEER